MIVLADDLTGASDAGVMFAERAARTTVWLDRLTALDIDANVLVVDMDSRAADPAHAYARMRALLTRLRPESPRAVVKKMDSTLRGNTGPELRALLEALPDAFAIVCPAFPKQGRVGRGGVLYVHGTPVDRTDFGRDLFSPVRDARVAAQLESPSVLLTLESIRGGTNVLNDEIERARALGVRIAVADAETDDDLHQLVALQNVREDVLWIGSAGLLDALAQVIFPRSSIASSQSHAKPAPHRSQRSLVEGNVLIVGSISAMTRRQIAAFALHPEFHLESIAPAELLENGASVARAVARAATAVARGTDAMIALDARDVDEAIAHGAHGEDVREAGRRIREALVATADSLIDSNAGRAVVLSGGDVARSFCERRGIRGLEVIAEAAPGIPLSRAIGANLYVVTKAGGFGHPETYRDIVATLRAKVNP